MERIGQFIARKRYWVLVLAILLSIPAAYSSLNTELNYDILSYLPEDVESVKGQRILDESFGSSDTGILIFKGVEEFRIKEMEVSIEKLEGVKDVLWARDLMDVQVPVEIMPDEVQEIFYHEDAVLLMINFEDSAAADSTQTAVQEIRKLVSQEEAYLTGASAIIRDVIDLSDKQKNLYIALAVVLALIILALALPSTVIPIIFIVGIGFGVLFNMGTNFFLKDVSYVTNAIAGVLQLGVTMDFSIFLYHRYEEERDKYEDHIQAMGVAIAKTATSISGAALTTIAGFLALVAMQLTLGANIGLVMAKGVLLGVISTLTIMPALLLVFDKLIHRFNHGTLMPSFKKTSKFIVKHHIVLLVVCVALLVPAYYGSANKPVYYKLDSSLPRDMDSIVSLEEMKDSFNMKSIYHLAISRDVEDYQVKDMIQELEGVEGVNQVVGYQKLIGPMLPKEMLPGDLLEAFANEEFTKITLTSEYSAATDEGNAQKDAIEAIVKSYDQKGVLSGEIPMTKDLIEVTDKDIKVVNTLSVVLLVIIIGLTFKSALLPIILVVSIQLAVLINMGLPYYMDSPIPFIASIVIGSIQLGTTVDYAILLTNRFKEEISLQENKFVAMEEAIKSCSKSIVTSGLTFFGSTFAVALVSDMDMISTLAMMMGRGALISMIIIMFLLPSLLLVFEGAISKTTMKWPKIKKQSVIKTKTNRVG